MLKECHLQKRVFAIFTGSRLGAFDKANVLNARRRKRNAFVK